MASIINAATSGGLVTTADTSGILQLQTAGTTAVTVNASQNVGIGTDAPTQALDVQKSQGWITTTSTTGTLSSLFKSSNTGGSSYFGRDNSTGGVLGSAAYATVVYGSGAYPMTFHTNDTERMRIDSSGNVGIGTSSPSQKLSVNGGSTQTVANFTSTSTAVYYALLNSGSQVFIGNDSTSGSFVIQTPSGGYSTKLTVDNAGGLKILNTISVGNATPSTSGAGITFPATQSASSNANTLDDYEEGTFTPVISGTSTAGTGTYSLQNGAYVKIGKMVQYQIYIILTAHTGTGDIAIGGLPFTASAGYYPPAAVYTNNLTLTALNYPQITVSTTSTNFFVRQVPVGGGATSAIPMDTAFDILLSGTYQV